jgi:threonine/homoserine/homoserine lactone efflux protein
MIEALLKGFLLGLVLMLSVGPAFFAVIDTSINKGFKTALYFTFGVWLSDVTYILLTNLGATQLLTQRITAVYFVGGAVLIVIGILMFLKKQTDVVEHVEIKKGDLLKFFGKGWLINTTAPGVILFWAAAALHLQNEQYNLHQKIAFFAAAVSIVITTDIGKAFSARKLKDEWLEPSVIHLVNKLSGIGMIIFGAYMIFKGFIH